jgi:hypothetical protein
MAPQQKANSMARPLVMVGARVWVVMEVLDQRVGV